MEKLILYKVARPLIKVFMKVAFRIEIVDSENIPDNNCILAGNHTNNLDSLLLIASTKRTIRFLAKKELIDGKFSFIFKNMGIIPVDRSKKNPNVTNAAIKILENNGLICIFPEGTINRTNETIMPFKYGAVSISVKTSSPIVPFIIKGTYKIFRKNIKIKFLKPIEFNFDNLEEYNIKLMEIIRSELERE